MFFSRSSAWWYQFMQSFYSTIDDKGYIRLFIWMVKFALLQLFRRNKYFCVTLCDHYSILIQAEPNEADKVRSVLTETQSQNVKKTSGPFLATPVIWYECVTHKHHYGKCFEISLHLQRYNRKLHYCLFTWWNLLKHW